MLAARMAQLDDGEAADRQDERRVIGLGTDEPAMAEMAQAEPRDRLAAADDERLLDAIEIGEPEPPALAELLRRVAPGRGGKAEETLDRRLGEPAPHHSEGLRLQ